MTTNELMDQLNKAIERPDLSTEEVQDYLAGLQSNLAEHPLDSTAYAGIARCREMLGDDPKTTLDYYVLALTLDGQNKNAWSMLGTFAARRGGITAQERLPEPSTVPIPISSQSTPIIADQTGNKITDIITRIKEHGHKKLIVFLMGCLILTYTVIFGALRS